MQRYRAAHLVPPVIFWNMAGEVRGSPGTRPRDFWKGRVTICRRIPSRLDGGVFVYVDDGCTFGADSLLLADFARPAGWGIRPGAGAGL